MSLGNTKLWLGFLTAQERLDAIGRLAIDYEDNSTKEDLENLLQEAHLYATYPVLIDNEGLENVITFWEEGNIISYLNDMIKPDLISEGMAFDTFLSKDIPTVRSWCEENGYTINIICLHSTHVSKSLTDVGIYVS